MARERGVELRVVGLVALFACFWTSSLMVRQSAADVPLLLHYTSRAVEIAVCLLVAVLAHHAMVKEQLLRLCAGWSVAIYAVLELARLVALPLLPVWAPSVFGVLCGVANGMSVGLVVLLFARRLCAIGAPRVAVMVPAAFGCSHALFLLMGVLPVSAIPWTKLVLLLVAAGGLLLGLRCGDGDAKTPWAMDSVGYEAETPLARLTLWLGMVVFPLLYGFMAQICAAAQISSGLFDVSTELVDIACMGALAVGAQLRYGRFDIESAFAVILSLFATAFLVLPVFWGNEIFVAGFIMKCGFGVYTAMLWVALLRMTAGDSTRCFAVFGLSLGIYHAALMVGRLLAHGLTAYHLLSYQTLAFVALAVVWLLSMAALVVLLANRRSRMVVERSAPSYEEAFDMFAASCGLSDRERAVCREYARGRTIDYIASNLQVSQETVKTHLKRAYAKSNCHSRQDLLDRIDSQQSESA